METENTFILRIRKKINEISRTQGDEKGLREFDVLKARGTGESGE